MLPTTLLEKFCTPVTTDPANADPGRVGMEGPPRLVVGAEVGAVRAGAPP